MGKHNKVSLSDNEFKQIINYINKGNIFERTKILRDRVPYIDDQGEPRTIELINQIHWYQNEFQVTQQIAMEGQYKNRYDVTILINGLPLVQIDLKRRGAGVKKRHLTRPTAMSSILLGRSGDFPICADLCDQQRGQYQVLRQQPIESPLL